MRILNVTAQKPDSTGSGVFLGQMVRCMVAAGHEAAVVCGVAVRDAPERSLEQGVLVRAVRFGAEELPFPVCGMSDVMPYEATRYCDMTPDMVGRFKAAFVLPSFFEGLPLVIIEALACGCKVVTTDLPGVRPWLSESVPDAPVTYVTLPRMIGVDEPDPEDLPAFESRLAAALGRAVPAPAQECDVSALTWESLTDRVISAICDVRGGVG